MKTLAIASALTLGLLCVSVSAATQEEVAQAIAAAPAPDITAGNASQMNDAAAAMIIAERSVAERLGLPIRARFVQSPRTRHPEPVEGCGSGDESWQTRPLRQAQDASLGLSSDFSRVPWYVGLSQPD